MQDLHLQQRLQVGRLNLPTLLLMHTREADLHIMVKLQPTEIIKLQPTKVKLQPTKVKLQPNKLTAGEIVGETTPAGETTPRGTTLGETTPAGEITPGEIPGGSSKIHRHGAKVLGETAPPVLTRAGDLDNEGEEEIIGALIGGMEVMEAMVEEELEEVMEAMVEALVEAMVGAALEDMMEAMVEE